MIRSNGPIAWLSAAAATREEKTHAEAFLREQISRLGPQPDAPQRAFVDFCHVLLNANEFLYV